MFKRDKELIEKLLDKDANHCLTPGDCEYIANALYTLARWESRYPKEGLHRN